MHGLTSGPAQTQGGVANELHNLPLFRSTATLCVFSRPNSKADMSTHVTWSQTSKTNDRELDHAARSRQSGDLPASRMLAADHSLK